MADTNQILRLAAIIREVDGNHSKGAAALAESILDHPDFRAALAKADEPAVPQGREPAAVTGQPSDEELWELYQGPGTFSPIEYAHDLLARWGNPTPQPPADGEVAELVRTMRMEVAAWNDNKSAPYWLSGPEIARVAGLLEQQVLVPVSISERLPGPEDCNAEGRCWWFAPETEVDFGGWTFGTTEICANSQWVDWENTHWLPAHALPLPEVGA